MTPGGRQPLQASIKQRLLNIAQRDGVDFQLILTRYTLERLLYRLGCSVHKSAFLLKGAFLFHAWQDDMARPTRDLDLLGHGSPDITRLATIVAEIVNTEVEDDGLDFLPKTIAGHAIRESSLYDGIRFKLIAMLGRTRIPVQIDIGFGDAAGVHAAELVYPTLFDQHPPRILSYRPEFVVAEKLEAMVALGLINSRIKDYYDLWRINRTIDITRKDLVAAVRTTFVRRGTDFPSVVPPGLTNDFADKQKCQLWEAFIERNGLDVEGAELEDVLKELRAELWPLILEAKRSKS